MMYKISKQFAFSASHQLHGLPEGHKCGRLHGHNYIVELILQSPTLDQFGFVTDYGNLNRFKEYIDTQIDHRHLEDIFSFQTSSENLARHFFEVAREMFGDIVVCCRIYETEKTYAEYYPN